MDCGNRELRVSVRCRPIIQLVLKSQHETFRLWGMAFDDIHPLGWELSANTWFSLGGSPPAPRNTVEALLRQDELAPELLLTVGPDNRWYRS